MEIAGNFTVKKYEWITFYGMYNQSVTSWNITRQLFLNGSLDLGMGFFSYVPNNLKEFDLCEPLMKLEFVFVIRHPELAIHVPWSGYLKVGMKIVTAYASYSGHKTLLNKSVKEEYISNVITIIIIVLLENEFYIINSTETALHISIMDGIYIYNNNHHICSNLHYN